MEAPTPLSKIGILQDLENPSISIVELKELVESLNEVRAILAFHLGESQKLSTPPPPFLLDLQRLLTLQDSLLVSKVRLVGLLKELKSVSDSGQK